MTEFSPPRIRDAVPDDLPAMEALLREAELPLDGLADARGEGYAVAESGGRIVASAGVEVYGRHGLLRSVAVAQQWRGRGLGERLVRDRLRWAEEKGLDSLYLLTTTAEGFFPRVGFTATTREQVPSEVRGSQEFASVCPASAAVMRLEVKG